MFMNCDDENYKDEELAVVKAVQDPMEDEDEEDPIWDQVDIEVIKRNSESSNIDKQFSTAQPINEEDQSQKSKISPPSLNKCAIP